MIRIAWGHYTIGNKGGVNTVMKRNISNLVTRWDDYRITVFGKASDQIESFLDFSHPRLSYIDMPFLQPGGEIFHRSIDEQDYHDYRWMGAQIEKKFIELIEEYDLVFFENSTVGANPAVNVAFSFYTQGSLSYRPGKKFLFRAHDFFFDRPGNFRNIKKIRGHRNDMVQDWHPVVFLDYGNVHYIAINSRDILTLYEHGIPEERIHYLPNSVNVAPEDGDKGPELRRILESKGVVEKDEKIILYPIRIAPRKNVEEALLLTMLFNRLADPDAPVREKFRTEGRYRLIVSLDTTTEKFKPYAAHIKEFVRKYRIPAVIGVGDYVSLERRYAPDGSIASYSMADLYSMADIVITTSILEGFGMVFIEPWLFDRPLVGRNLFVTKDFREAGMKLGHLYDALRVKGTDFPRYGTENHSHIRIATNEYAPRAVEKRLRFVNELREPETLREFTEDNYLAVNAMLSMLRASHNYLTYNKAVVQREYSDESVAEKLDGIFRRILGG